MPLIETQNVTFKYGVRTPMEKTAVDDLSVCFEAGEIVGIIGHTGSGKSTFVQLLNGLLRPASGRVLLEGRDIWEKPKKIRDVRFKVGLVFQYPEYQLFEETCRRDIGYGPRNMGLNDEQVNEAVERAAVQAGVKPELMEKSPFELSGGEKRRVAIAGVMAMGPRVLILDEPTAGLDPQARDKVLQRIKAYSETTGALVLLVSHRMEDIAAICDRIMVMSKARMIMFGTVDEVFSRYDELKAMGLSMPQVSRVLRKLKLAGYPVNTHIYDEPSACAEIMRLVKQCGIKR